jgi:hypothetical protein
LDGEGANSHFTSPGIEVMVPLVPQQQHVVTNVSGAWSVKRLLLA